MKSAFLTVEFWVTMVTNVVGLVVLFGGLSAEKAGTLTSSLTVIIGAVLPLVASTVYAKSRSELKRAIADATLYRLVSTDSDGKVRTASVDDAVTILKRLGI